MRATSILLGLALALAQPAGATVLSDWKLEEIVQRSDLIVIGTVRAARGVEGEGTVLTASKIEVERTLFDASAGAAHRFIEVWELVVSSASAGSRCRVRLGSAWGVGICSSRSSTPTVIDTWWVWRSGLIGWTPASPRRPSTSR